MFCHDLRQRHSAKRDHNTQDCALLGLLLRKSAAICVDHDIEWREATSIREGPK